MKFVTTALFFSVALSAFTACSQGPAQSAAPLATQSFVTSIQTDLIASDRPSPSIESPVSEALRVTAVVDKKALLSQEFLYGADLQYSSLYDSSMDLYNQSLAIGHVPARFRISGDELQLIADNRRLYPSEVNHPEQLLTRFKILSQTESSLTISDGNAGVFLASVFQGTHDDTHGGLTAPVKSGPIDRWTRSFEFIPNGNYLLQQTSIVLGDGKESVAEFMEAIFPRSTLIPGEKFEKFEMDPNNPIGGDSDVLTRYRLLPGETNFAGEKKFAMAQHFDISKGAANSDGTIDWYVTRNISDEDIVPVKLAVEGWNRYFNKFKGIERDVVLFKGRLPEGIHLGDPRFNCINWDSRLIAGAAYETQATDPSTGKQSHSLIYMPAAWLQIGFDYWKMGQYSDNLKSESVSPLELELRGGAARAARLACLRDVQSAALLMGSGRLSSDEVKEFGKRLLKGTLFHEVGHALGLAHNFKGSLAFDRSKPGSIFSTSIMDYNDYEIERAAFPELLSSDGPQLEYDRQILSAIYNKGVDVSEKDAVLPTCNDAEADAEDGGVDPLCIRYDLEKDPTLSVNTALDRINLATKAGDVTVAEALTRVPDAVLTMEALASVKTKSDLQALAAKLAGALKSSMKFYLIGGKASLSRVVRTNVKSLLEFQEAILPAGYEELAMRERAFAGVQKTLALKALPEAVTTSLGLVEKASVEALAKTVYVQSLPAGDRTLLTTALGAAIHKAAMSVESDTANGLPKLRAAILTALARHKKVPFFFGKPEGADQSIDFESSIVGILGDAVMASAATTKLERVTAATALATYSGRAQGEAAIAAIHGALVKARLAATDNESRELVEELLAALKPLKDASEE